MHLVQQIEDFPDSSCDNEAKYKKIKNNLNLWISRIHSDQMQVVTMSQQTKE
jgi:hypothetical protein